MFETTINTMQATVVAVDPQGGDTPTEMHIILMQGFVLPIAGPDGQPIQVPMGNFRFPLSKEYGVQFLQKGLEVAEGISDTPQIAIASDLRGAADLAELTKRMKGNNHG